MSRTFTSVVLASLIGAASIEALATDQVKGFYVGVGYGTININSEEEDVNFSRAKNGSLHFGYSFSENWSVEAQFSRTVAGGTATIEESFDVTREIRASAISQGLTPSQAEQAVAYADVDVLVKVNAAIDNYGLFGVYRTSGPIYAKFKAGVLNVRTSADSRVDGALLNIASVYESESYPLSDSEVDSLNTYIEPISESETKFSYGLGGGYKISDKFAVEMEFTRLLNDYNSYTLSAKYHF
jgi:opacity protein-like surface antigen